VSTISFSLLWTKILRSSLWIGGTKDVRLLWITLLALKDKDGFVESSFPGLADAAKLTQDECRAALEVLTSPDPHDTSGVDQGIRVKKVDGGWTVTNHDKYRFSTEAKREFWREQKADARARKIEVVKK
jgi:hypothetical protein